MAEKKNKTAEELQAETNAESISGQPKIRQTASQPVTATNPNASQAVAVTDEASGQQNYKNAVNNYNRFTAAKPVAYQSSFQDQLDSLTNQILNGGKFTFNMNTDELYNQYKDMYMKQGKQAAEDTMGQAAALSGGYGNSYATTAANQAYQGYMDQLNERALDIYDRRYNEWLNNRSDLYNQANLLQNRESTEYGRYRDTVSDWQADRAQYYQEMMDAYEQGDNERAFAYSQMIDELDRAYQKERDAVSDAQWQQSFDFQKERAAVADQQWQQEFDYNNQVSALNSQISSLSSQLQSQQDAQDYEKQLRSEIRRLSGSTNAEIYDNAVNITGDSSLVPTYDNYAALARETSLQGSYLDYVKNYLAAKYGFTI